MAEIQPGWFQQGGLTGYAFPASHLGVYGEPAGAGPGGAGFVPLSVDDILSRSGAYAALDGTQFDNCPGQNLPGDNSAYASSQCGYPDFLVLDADRGVSAPSLRPNDGMTISIANGQASALPGSQTASGATVAVQLYPGLVMGGAVVVDDSGTNADQEWRAGLAIMSPNQLVFAVAAMDMAGFANALLSLGATDAGYTDGGGSAALAVPGMTFGPRPPRRVPTWLIAKQPSSSAGIAVVAGIVVAGAAWWWIRRSR